MVLSIAKCKQMSSGSFKNFIYKLFAYKLYMNQIWH